jgi:hypothetical protein
MQTLGLISLFWQGNQIPIQEGGSFTIGGPRNQPIIVGQSVMRAQKMMQSDIMATTVVQAGQSISALLGTSEGELQIQCDTGQTFVWESAFLIESPKVTAGEGGKVELHFVGGAPQELT